MRSLCLCVSQGSLYCVLSDHFEFNLQDPFVLYTLSNKNQAAGNFASPASEAM